MCATIRKFNLQRNSLCWCGSGKKYKKCHLKTDQSHPQNSQSHYNPKKIHRSRCFIEGMEASCRLAKETLLMVEGKIRAGITTNDIDCWVHDYTIRHNAVPAPLNYKGFPKSVCTSLNEVICHGIPSERIIHNGDIINVDITCILDGYYGDTSKTFLIGKCSDEAKKITAVSRECLRIGIEATKPYGHIGDIGAAIQQYAESQNCSVVEHFVGHGIGQKFHTKPQVPHFGKKGTGPLILPGMFFTIEPMINFGQKGVKILEDGWTAVTIDNKLSAQFEHTLFIGEDDIRVLTL